MYPYFIHPNPQTFDSISHQYFSLPSTIVNYIAHNPLSADGLQKLQKTCKYFFAKKKIIVVNVKVQSNKDSLINLSYFTHLYTLPLRKARYWLNNGLHILSGGSKILSQNVYRCSLKTLDINKNNLTLKEFDFLSDGGKLTSIWLNNVNIQDKDGNVITCDKILAKLPHIQDFRYECQNEIFTSETFQKMNKLKFQSKFEWFRLREFNVSEDADFFYLCKFIQNNTAAFDAKFIFNFQPNFSEERFQAFSNMLTNSHINWIKAKKVVIQLCLANVSTFIKPLESKASLIKKQKWRPANF